MAKSAKKNAKPAVAKKLSSKQAIGKKPRAVKARLAPHGFGDGVNAAVLDRLYNVVMDRRTADPELSHSARLLSRGKAKVAQKFGEEAVECLIEGVTGNRTALIGESADVLYHLIVLWVSSGIRPDEVWAELHRREGVSGIAEKAARPAIETKKIP